MVLSGVGDGDESREGDENRREVHVDAVAWQFRET